MFEFARESGERCLVYFPREQVFEFARECGERCIVYFPREQVFEFARECGEKCLVYFPREQVFEFARECGERCFRFKFASAMPHLLVQSTSTASGAPSTASVGASARRTATTLTLQHCSKLIYADFMCPDDESKPYNEVK